MKELLIQNRNNDAVINFSSDNLIVYTVNGVKNTLIISSQNIGPTSIIDYFNIESYFNAKNIENGNIEPSSYTLQTDGSYLYECENYYFYIFEGDHSINGLIDKINNGQSIKCDMVSNTITIDDRVLKLHKADLVSQWTDFNSKKAKINYLINAEVDGSVFRSSKQNKINLDKKISFVNEKSLSFYYVSDMFYV